MKINFVTNIIADSDTNTTGDFTRKDLPPGSAEWLRDREGNISSLVVVCPGGCGHIVPITIARPGVNGWKWNGDMAAPTLTPSLQMNVHCRWHGYLTNGEWRPC